MNAKLSREQQYLDKLKLWHFQPKAREIRDEGKCDVCKRNGFLSYRLPGEPRETPYDRTMEYCGYFCPRCGFGNGGSRLLENDPEYQIYGCEVVPF